MNRKLGKILALACLPASAAAFGFLIVPLQGNPLLFIVATFVQTAVVAALVTWCLLDAKDRDYDMPPLLMVGIVLMPLIFVPVFLVLSRDRRPGLAVFLAGLVFLFVVSSLILSMAASSLLFFGPGEFA
jgi:hypothetical protein